MTIVRLPAKRSKYNAVRTVIDGITFDSKREAAYYCQLKVLEKAGKIRDMEVHPTFPLTVSGRACGKYVGDFSYIEIGHSVVDGAEVTRRQVIDVKGVKTAVYKLKKKLMLAIYGIEVQEL